MFVRTAMTGLLVAAVLAIFPALAGAAMTPTVTLNQGAGTQAGSSPVTGVALGFKSPAGFESVKDMTIGFPAGFFPANLGANGGACVASTAPTPLCEIATGTASIEGKTGVPLQLYLVGPPTLADVAGIAMVIPGRATVTGALTLQTSPTVSLSLAFSGIATGITEVVFNLSSPRLPSSCAVPPAVTLSADSWGNSSGSASAPMTVTGCGAMPFAPTVAATVTKEPPVANEGAEVQVTLSFPPGSSAPSAIELGNPTGVKINKVLSPCFKGVNCTVGTVTGESPLLPPTALNSGQLTLTGTINSGSLANPIQGSVSMSFPPPYQLAIQGPINLVEHDLTFLSMPDIPISTLTYTFTGTPEGPAFVTACESGTIAASIVPQDGNAAVKVTGPVTNVGCPPPGAKPTASGSLGGLSSGKPQLRLHVSHGAVEPDLSSLQVSLPSGLSFSHKLTTTKTCTGSGHSRSCTLKVKGLSLSGATIKSLHAGGSSLSITMSHPAAKVTLTAVGPLLTESSSLKHKAKEHKAGNPQVRVKVTDTGGLVTALSAA